MTKNSLLNIGIILCKFLRLLLIVGFVGLIGILIHLQISPSTYKNVDINRKQIGDGLSFNISSFKTHVDGQVLEDSAVFILSDIKTSSLYFNFMKYSIILLLSFFCLKEFQKVIESVKEINTFQQRNVLSFKRIGMYMLIIFVLEIYTSLTFKLGGFSGFYVSFEPLIFAVLAFIMAEIFTEGNKLSEENKLTV